MQAIDMKKLILNVLFLTASCLCAACGGSSDTPEPAPVDPTPTDENLDPQQPAKTNAMKVYVHYMPWFVSPQSSGVWNHWTMSGNPLAVDQSNFASHYHPLTGAYASNDEAILDYQCLLMKYAGIEGVMVDWYGTQQKNDYPQNETNTRALLKAVEKAQLKMAIVYEDATLDGLSDKQGQARSDMRHLQSYYFKSDSYTKVGDKPLLMCFGPQQLTTAAGWDYAFGALNTKPQFVVLNGFSSRANAQGEFLWVNPNPDYSRANTFDTYIAGAMPGFWDVYKQFGQGNGYTTYDREDGALFLRQLNAAKTSGLELLQISTWNDYGEGTIVEPTKEFGYQYLKMLQQFCGVSYAQSHLELVYRWYVQRVAHPKDQRVSRAYTYLNALQPLKAEVLIEELEKI